MNYKIDVIITTSVEKSNLDEPEQAPVLPVEPYVQYIAGTKMS